MRREFSREKVGGIGLDRIIIFSGTTEGREISSFLSENRIKHTVCVATEYGNLVMDKSEYAYVYTGRLDENEMIPFIKENGSIVVDATHPYAANVTKNIVSACEQVGAQYYRVVREDMSLSQINSEFDDVYVCENIAESVRIIEGLIKNPCSSLNNIMLTTGSKDIAAFAQNEAIRERLYVRILPSEDSIGQCRSVGIMPDHIIAMQGPFSVDMNRALIREFDIGYLVTKSSGAAGGFLQKLQAAKEEKIKTIIIKRPEIENGYSVAEIKNKLKNHNGE